MAKQVLNTGTINNDKTGDSLRAGGLKIKSNFDELYEALGAPAGGANAGILPMHPVCINGRYQDLKELPPFKPLATSANWDDVENKPIIAVLVSPPTGPTGLRGVDGHKRGNVATDANYFYMCFANYTDGADEIWHKTAWNEPTISLTELKLVVANSVDFADFKTQIAGL